MQQTQDHDECLRFDLEFKQSMKRSDVKHEHESVQEGCSQDAGCCTTGIGLKGCKVLPALPIDSS